MRHHLSRVVSLTGILLLVLVVAGCGSTSSSTSSSADESTAVGNRAESFTKDFLEARVSDVSSYFADNVEDVTINPDGSTSSKTKPRDAMQATYLDYKTLVDQAKAAAQTAGTPLSVSAALTNTAISVSGATATVAGDVKLTVTAGGQSPSVDIKGCSITFTKAGSNWVITRWASPAFDPAAVFSGLHG